MTPDEFRTARKALGYSQKRLAEALRMGKHGWQTISKWEGDDFAGEIPGPVQVALECLLHHPPITAEQTGDGKRLVKTPTRNPTNSRR